MTGRSNSRQSVVFDADVGEAFPMRWFGFGFSAFGQIRDRGDSKKAEGGDVTEEVIVKSPTELQCCCSSEISVITSSWSTRVCVHVAADDRSVCVAGFHADPSSQPCGTAESRGCRDAFISERLLTLAFPDRVESWDLQRKDRAPSWSMEMSSQSEDGNGAPLSLPLVPGGYLATRPPLFRPLSPHLKAKSLALGGEHAVLLCDTGVVYTWGLGSHGQLGQGSLVSEEEPRAVEALWGMPMSRVAAGGWHSVCISDGGDLYVWGWNESGQLGLPSRGLRKAPRQQQHHRQEAETSCCKAKTDDDDKPQEGGKQEDVFISIQAFPALLDVTPSCEIRTVGCGSRHTAAVTTTGDLYTWGWGEYGQLGHRTLNSSDEPERVEFFREQQMCVVDVACGMWNTFAAVIEKDGANS